MADRVQEASGQHFQAHDVCSWDCYVQDQELDFNDPCEFQLRVFHDYIVLIANDSFPALLP